MAVNGLRKFGCPQKFVNIVKLLHENMEGSILCQGSESPSFQIKTGVKQGCVMTPTLFSIYVSVVILLINNLSREGMINYRLDGNLFNLSR